MAGHSSESPRKASERAEQPLSVSGVPLDALELRSAGPRQSSSDRRIRFGQVGKGHEQSGHRGSKRSPEDAGTVVRGLQDRHSHRSSSLRHLSPREASSSRHRHEREALSRERPLRAHCTRQTQTRPRGTATTRSRSSNASLSCARSSSPTPSSSHTASSSRLAISVFRIPASS